MKPSEITTENISDYLRLDYDSLTESEISDLGTLLTVAIAFIKSYTGLKDVTVEEVITITIDEHEEFTIVVYVLVEDMYDNRTYYVDKNNLNKVVQTILDMHSTNLL